MEGEYVPRILTEEKKVENLLLPLPYQQPLLSSGHQSSYPLGFSSQFESHLLHINNYGTYTMSINSTSCIFMSSLWIWCLCFSQGLRGTEIRFVTA